jgi:flagellar motor switch protein FliN/FliY
MAPKKAKIEDEAIETGDANAELDQAIDDLRGVLKADEAGLPDFGEDFGAEFGAGDAGAEMPMGANFGGGADFDGGGDFGDSAFGGNDFGSSASMGAVAEPGSALHANLDLIKDIPIDVQIILGTSKMQVSGLMNLTEGAIIALDRKIGEPVDLIVNGRLIGRGEITVLENDETRFGIKLLEVKPSGRP